MATVFEIHLRVSAGPGAMVDALADVLGHKTIEGQPGRGPCTVGPKGHEWWVEPHDAGGAVVRSPEMYTDEVPASLRELVATVRRAAGDIYYVQVNVNAGLENVGGEFAEVARQVQDAFG